MKNIGLIITCEHASNKIPAKHHKLFHSYQKLLSTHRGWDIGIIQLYRLLTKMVPAKFHCAKWSRLLVELNRSENHPEAFSEITQQLPFNQKEQILKQYYYPYRNAVFSDIEKLLLQYKQVIHVSLHSFTPTLNNEIRNADFGILYDPKRSNEKKFSKKFKAALDKNFPEFKTRFNYPYTGYCDGQTTTLRKKFPKSRYLGIEFEVNQKHLFTKNCQNKFIRELANTVSLFIHDMI